MSKASEKYSMGSFNKCVDVLMPTVSQANSERVFINKPEIIRLVSEQYFTIDHSKLTDKEKIAYDVLRDIAIDLKINGHFIFGSKEVDL